MPNKWLQPFEWSFQMSHTPTNSVVWMELPVTDLNRSIDFYSAVFGYAMTMDDSGPNPIAIFPAETGGVAGHLYPGTPPERGSGPTVHLIVPDSLEAAMERLEAAGGKIISPPIPLPDGRFSYAQDLDGNSIGLFERKAA